MTKFEFLKKIYGAFWANFEGRNYLLLLEITYLNKHCF